MPDSGLCLVYNAAHIHDRIFSQLIENSQSNKKLLGLIFEGPKEEEPIFTLKELYYDTSIEVQDLHRISEGENIGLSPTYRQYNWNYLLKNPKTPIDRSSSDAPNFPFWDQQKKINLVFFNASEILLLTENTEELIISTSEIKYGLGCQNIISKNLKRKYFEDQNLEDIEDSQVREKFKTNPITDEEIMELTTYFTLKAERGDNAVRGKYYSGIAYGVPCPPSWGGLNIAEKILLHAMQTPKNKSNLIHNNIFASINNEVDAYFNSKT